MGDQLFQVDIDTDGLLRALDEFGHLADALLLAAAMETARAIRTEAERRLRQQTHGTGQTASNLVATDNLPSWLGGGKGTAGQVFVYVRPVRRPDNLTIWLEYGTIDRFGRQHVSPRPFLYPAARLEEGPHRRRILEALQRALAQTGFAGGSVAA